MAGARLMRVHDDPGEIAVPEGVPRLLRDLVHDRAGIYFESDRFDALLEKLHDRVLAHGCHSYLDYYYILKYDEKKAAEEWLRVMDAFSVQETYFWRELGQIEALVREVIPAWFRERRLPFRIWSAACASGEEPYSIVMALHEAGLGDLPVEIWASDASEAALARARAGRYRERSFRALPEPLRQKYFTATGDGWQIAPAIRERVRFRRANLVANPDIHDLANAEVVFCRNVFIYFSPDAIRRTIDAFARRMDEGTHLFVGASESLLRLTTDFELRELGPAYAYVRRKRPVS